MKKCPRCFLLSPDETRVCKCGHPLDSAPAGGVSGILEKEVEPTSVSGVLQKEVKQGAVWFYLIAGLSAVNSVLAVLGVEITFLVGMGAAELMRAFFAGLLGIPFPNLGFEPALLPVLVAEIVIALSIAGLGWAASFRLRSAFLVGMVLYLLDALLTLAVGNLPGLAFHGLALFFMFKGFRALVKLRKVEGAAREPAGLGSKKWLRRALVGAPVVLIGIPFLVPLIVMAVMSGDWEMGESQALSRAPADFSEADRERLHRAFAGVASRFERDGFISNEEAAKMNESLMKVTNLPEGEFASREDLLELTRILETIAGTDGAPHGLPEARGEAQAEPGEGRE